MGNHLKAFQPGDYGKVLEEFRKNPMPLPRPPNEEILKHEQLHKVQSDLFVYRRNLVK